MNLNDDELLVYILIDEHPGLCFRNLAAVIDDRRVLSSCLHELARKNLIYADEHNRYHKKVIA